ncbi:MAG: 2-oxoacid:acceptor oxidoreductase family protein [Candidatus Eisenbacteria bacterium]|uniref:2-oxoacid:acceptor oxidoreductase family protein n=1 Tax=Eiseniibacteriota bacterium TaxID=2212470 RepID=A0A956LZF4_UNCEI|nr:2-oxoacid:acceptor oxidoreductase family protein [Candidatus Eisenbacteria bacterium]
MSNALYTHFERHAHGEGLKGSSTHYCPGCGHGLVHKMLAETLDELGVADRTVTVSPVGCAVFLYYYMDTGNTQAAHGRAPAVAVGHKLANPDSIVVSYQGDGDLASIGLTEIIHSAQVGLPITVIFVNNAIYGMTGGQMAPTTLPGQRTATTPGGRGRMEGPPLRVSEMLASLDGPVYIERVALYDQKTRKRARQAIKKALLHQVEGRGFALVEVLSECPTHLGKSGQEAEAWVRDEMTKVFPLGVYKDETRDPWWDRPKPSFESEPLDEILARAAKSKFSETPPPFATELDPEDISLKLAGAGGDGAQTAALLLTKAAVRSGFDATHIPSYGPESRGGTSYADVHIAREEVHSPAAPNPHVLVAFNAPSVEKFAPTVRPGGVIIYDSSVVSTPPTRTDVKIHPVPMSEIAVELGQRVVKNMVALGALQAATGILPAATLVKVLNESLAHKCALIPVNDHAFDWGMRAVRDHITHLD